MKGGEDGGRGARWTVGGGSVTVHSHLFGPSVDETQRFFSSSELHLAFRSLRKLKHKRDWTRNIFTHKLNIYLTNIYIRLT